MVYVTECSQNKTLQKDYETYGPWVLEHIWAALLLQTLAERLIVKAQLHASFVQI